MSRWNRRAQTTLEYAVLAVVVVAVLLVMQIYMKRGFSGKLKESTDRVGEQFTPHSATYKVNRGFTGARTEETFASGKAATTGVSDTQTRTGSENPVGVGMQSETLFP